MTPVGGPNDILFGDFHFKIVPRTMLTSTRYLLRSPLSLSSPLERIDHQRLVKEMSSGQEVNNVVKKKEILKEVLIMIL